MSKRNLNQIPLQLPAETSRSREDFILGSCNALAADWIDRWPDWPGKIKGLVIHGPPASGKSHLAAIWMEMTGGVMISRLDQTVLDRLGPEASLVLDNFMPSDDWPPDLLFHLLNRFISGQGSVLVLARQPVAEQSWQLADITSRLALLNSVAIQPPDDETLAAVLQKLADDRGLVLDADVVRHCLARMERSFAAARQLADLLNMESLARKQRVTTALAREVLDHHYQSRLL